MKNRKTRLAGAMFLFVFVLWTAAVCLVDVQPIGPNGSAVGFSALNGAFHHLTGVDLALYTVTDWLGLVPVGIGLGFALLGLWQRLGRKSLKKVDRSLLLLGGLYLSMLGAYLFFEQFVVNLRPVLLDGFLEASYPSSTVLLALCVLPSAIGQLNARIRHGLLRRCTVFALAALAAFMVVGRLLSGVHWLTDVIGSILLSAGLVLLFAP